MKEIPKIIHYCWFGKKEMEEEQKQCILSWKKFLPNYEIKEWNESNFDIEQCQFAREAYEQGKYAFVSDYARAKILYEEGGIYLDTDMKVLREIPTFIIQNQFLGFERKAFVGTAIMGMNAGNEMMKAMVEHYEQHSFVQSDGTTDQIANVSLLTDFLKQRGLVLGGERQSVAGIEIYPREWFYPKKLGEGKFRFTEDTVAVHLCKNSWMSTREKKRGNSFVWTQIIRPLLRGGRRVGIAIVGKERIRKLEIKIRDRLR